MLNLDAARTPAARVPTPPWPPPPRPAIRAVPEIPHGESGLVERATPADGEPVRAHVDVAADFGPEPAPGTPAESVATDPLAQPPAVARQKALRQAVHGLRDHTPKASAAIPLVRWQQRVLIVFAGLLVGGLVLAPTQTTILLTAAATALYLSCMAQRVQLFIRGLDESTILTVSDAAAFALTDNQLPKYTVLVPAYGEPQVVAQLMRNLGALNYPIEKLEVLLLLEEDDEATIAAAQQAGIVAPIRLLLVPPSEPRTKPKACNYGMEFATGEFTTIYDAEDEPEPLQLRRAVALLRQHPDLSCIQARLAFHNSRQNLLTGWFAAEYGLWFGYLLPGLARTGGPVPLGGTSNHLRTSVLRSVGGWDPYNVTEDADLGMRLARRRYKTGVLDSVTFEEANSDPINWVRQRSRWYKGYLQSWLVAMRSPRETVQALGLGGTVAMTLLLAGTPVAACVNLAFWMVSLVWVLGQPAAIGAAFPPYVYYPALINIFVGNLLALYSNLIGARANSHHRLLVACLLSPLYWLLMAVAAVKGCWQLLARPSYWEKTVHGLDVTDE